MSKQLKMTLRTVYVQFASGQVFCEFQEFFALLDAYNQTDRYFVLGPVSQPLLRSVTMTVPRWTSEAEEAEMGFQRFKQELMNMIVSSPNSVHLL